MERFTSRDFGESGRVIEKGQLFEAPDGFFGPAADRLAQFEDALERILQEQEELAQKLEKLRAAGRKNSVQFRELLGKKLLNSRMLTALRVCGMESL